MKSPDGVLTFGSMQGSKPRSSDGSPMKIIGRRLQHVGDGPPSLEAREAMGEMARYRTRVPKGIFIYRSHDEANADCERWLVDAMVAKAQSRRNG